MKNRFRLIMGKNCISEVLRSNPERIVEFYTSAIDEKDPLITLLRSHKVPIVLKQKEQLSKIVSSDSHQSAVAAIKEKHSVDIKSFLKEAEEKSSSLVLMVDSIFDPQNLGAILRSAECFGADLVIFSKNRGADLTPVASKASVGASELLDIVKVSNLADTLKKFQDAGYWSVCADGGEGAESLETFSFPEKTLLIVGSEGVGVQPLIKKNTDFRVKIPMKGNIDCLNVSQATSVMLYAYSSRTTVST